MLEMRISSMKPVKYAVLSASLKAKVTEPVVLATVPEMAFAVVAFKDPLVYALILDPS